MQRFPIQPVTDATVTEIIERLYNQRPHLERLMGGVNYPVYAFSFGDGNVERVIKLAGETITPEMRQELTLWELYALVMDVGWLTELGRQAEAESQLAFAQQWLKQTHPV